MTARDEFVPLVIDHKRSRMVSLVQDKATLSAAPVAAPALWLRLCRTMGRTIGFRRRPDAPRPRKILLYAGVLVAATMAGSLMGQSTPPS
jgi:hypothetical protein